MPPLRRLPRESGVDSASGRVSRDAPAPHAVNETKLAILAVMRELDRPVTAEELHAVWGGNKRLSVFEYHLSTLVMLGIAELIIGSELRFSLCVQSAVARFPAKLPKR